MEGVVQASGTAAAAAAAAVALAVPSSFAGDLAGEILMRATTIHDFNTSEGLPPVRPPPGIVPELQNPPNAGQGGNVAGLAICISAATILFAVRSYVKFRIRRNYLVEDVTCTIAWVLLIFYASCVFVMISYDVGYESGTITRANYSQMLKWLYISSLVYCPTAFFTKVTLLLLIARVFTVRTGVTYAIYAFILVLALAYIPIEIAKIDICNPIQSYWNPAVDGRCLDQRKIFLADLGVAITTDFVILVVPIPLTWKMRTGWQKKLKIVGMLGAGGSALGVTIYRLVLVIKSTNTEGQAHSDFILLDLLQIIEITIGLCCSCLPALNILLAHHFYGRHWLASLRGGSDQQRDSGGTSGSSEANARDMRRRHPWVFCLLRGIGVYKLKSFSTPKSPSPRNNNTTTTTSDNTRKFSNTSAPPPPPPLRRNTVVAAMVPRWEGGEFAGEDEEDRTEWEEQQRRREKGRQVDFDLELAMLSPGGRFPSTAPMSPHHNDSWFVVERANSIDGRRDGWLEDTSSANKTTSQTDNGESSGGGPESGESSGSSSRGHLRVEQPPAASSRGGSRGGSRDRQQGEIEIELAKITGNKPWEMIYDGRHNH